MPTISDAQAGLISTFAQAHPVAFVFAILAIAVALAIVLIALTARKAVDAKPELLVSLLTHNNSKTDQIAEQVSLIMTRQETILSSVSTHEDLLQRVARDVDGLAGRVQALEDLVCRNDQCPNRRKDVA